VRNVRRPHGTGLSSGSGPGPLSRLRCRRPHRADRGATLVEMAIVFPILLAILIAIAEIGLHFKDYLTVSYASREGARIGAFAGTDPAADCLILTGIGAILTPSELSRLDRVEIFLASQGGAQLDTNIARYDGDDPLSCHVEPKPEDGWVISPAPWKPHARQTVVGSVPLDIIGVRVVMKRSWITNFPPFQGDLTVEEVTLTRLEPEAFETP